MLINDLEHLPETIQYEIIAYLNSDNFKAAKVVYDVWLASLHPISTFIDEDDDFESL